MSTEKIMEQAQVFASAWSLVGGRFDNGGMVEIATEEKAELKTAIEALVQQRDKYQRAADAMAMSHKVERDALRADAERYRWLRDAEWTENSHPEVWRQLLCEYGELDAAIDAAMKGKS